MPAELALAGALATGAVATAIALRWEAQGIAALGIVGAVFSPALLGADDGAGIAMLAIATASATVVVTWQRWTWLAAAAFGIAAPQWLAYILTADRPTTVTLAVLIVFGTLAAAAAVGFEVRQAAPRLRISAAALLTVNAIVLAAGGAYALGGTAGNAWIAALAVAHAAMGLAAMRTPRVSHELSLTAIALGVVLADIAYAAFVDGLPLLAGYALSGVGFAALLRKTRADDAVIAAGLGGQLLLSLGHAIVLDAPVSSLPGGYAGPEALLALAIVAAGCAVSARLADELPELRATLDGVAMAVLAYLIATALEGPALAAALAGQAVALGAVARRAQDGVAAAGAAAFLALGAAYALVVLAPPTALVDGLADPLGAAPALGALVAATGALAALAPTRARKPLATAAAVTALYLASVELVTAVPGLGGQALLSALWALAGFATLVAGLLTDRAPLRHGALALLGVTTAKVFLYDLASLSEIYRVASFIVLGLLLLGGAFAWQRVRPRPLPDLREMPQGLR